MTCIYSCDILISFSFFLIRNWFYIPWHNKSDYFLFARAIDFHGISIESKQNEMFHISLGKFLKADEVCVFYRNWIFHFIFILSITNRNQFKFVFLTFFDQKFMKKKRFFSIVFILFLVLMLNKKINRFYGIFVNFVSITFLLDQYTKVIRQWVT